jgi:hypothetical protein
VAAVRVLGLVGIAAGGALLGSATARLVGRRPGVVVALGVAASTGFYASGLRTPSYNWLAVVGAELACAAALHVLAGGSPRWGLLAGAGIVLAAGGKITTGMALLLVVVAVAVAARRPAAAAWSVGALAVAAVVHLTFVLPAGDSAGQLTRSATLLAVMDPEHYSVGGSLAALGVGLEFLALAAAVGGGLVGLLPLAAAAPHARQELWFRRLCLLAAIGAIAVALATGAWSGVLDRPSSFGGGLVPVLVAIALAVAIGRRLPLGRAPRPGTQLAGVAVLLLAALAYLFGSNIRADAVLETATVLLAPACLLLTAALPSSARDTVCGGLVACLLAGSLVTAAEAHAAPKRGTSLATSTAPVPLGRATVRVDPATASSLTGLVAAARAAGWRDGTPLIDAGFVPAVPLALHARVPPVLVPGVPGWSMATVCLAVRGLGRQWSDAWIAVDRTHPADGPEVGRALGRPYPAGYVVVGTLTGPRLPAPVTLLRPRPGGTAAAGCLSDRPGAPGGTAAGSAAR